VTQQTSTPSPGPFAPLRRAAFRSLWIAALASNIGTWIHEVGAGWAMTELGPSSLMVALIQASTTLPMFILSLPAGAFADVINRRKLMLWMQGSMFIIALILAIAAWQGFLTPGLLIAATLGLGIGAAMVNPAWQTAMSDLVPYEELSAASALNSVSLNLSRAVGPAIGGFLVAQAGPYAAFSLNALSFIGILGALWLWKYQPPRMAAPGERFIGAMKAGIRYIRHSPHMRAQLVRTGCFSLFGSAMWALLPVVARKHLNVEASSYGLLLASLGGGAVIGTLILPRIRARFGPNTIVVSATLVAALAITSIGLSTIMWMTAIAICFGGLAWVTMVVCLNVAAMTGSPPWVRARALACYFTIFYGGMALGSIVWGGLADVIGIPNSLYTAAGLLVLGLATMGKYRLQTPAQEDLKTSAHWEDPVVSREINADDGPVVITVEYRIRTEDADNFVAAMMPVSQTRYRDGAFSWTLSRCTENPERWLEIFMVESWAEHLRQHSRVTMSDRRLQTHAKTFQIDGAKPVVSHFIAAGSSSPQSAHAPHVPHDHDGHTHEH
jgi:MFS family permease